MGRIAVLLSVLALAGCGRLGFGDDQAPGDCALTIAPTDMRLNFNSTRTFVADGGLAPYHFTSSDTPMIDRDTGAVAAGDQPQTSTITVTDDAGCTADATLKIGGDTLWYVGGTSMSVPSAQVWKSTNGATWTLAGSLPDKRTSGALFVFHDRMWWATGSDGVGVRSEVFSTADGVTWTPAGNVVKGVQNPGFAVFNDKMFLIGGAGNPDIDEVYSSDDGATWTLVGHLPQLNHGGATAVVGGKLWYLGGHNTSSGMLYRWVLSSSDGVTFQQPGMMATGREYASAIAADGRIVIAGGQDTTPTTMASVLSTTNGTSFVTEMPLPVARAFTALVRFDDFMYSIGGNDGGGIYATAVNGSTPWLQATPADTFPKPRQGGRVAVFSPAP